MATRVSCGRICLASFNSTITKIPTRRKHLVDIFHTSWVMAHFVLNFVVITTGLVVVDVFWHPSVTQPRKIPCWTQRSPGCLICKPSYGRFCLKFRSMAWQHWSVLLKFVSRHWIAWFPKTPVRHTNLRDISYTSWVRAHFVSNIVAMATRVERGRVCATSFNSATTKTPVFGRKDLLDISYTSRVIADFVSNFVAMATGVGRSRICLASFNSPTPKTPCYTQRAWGYLLYTVSQKSSTLHLAPYVR